MKRESHRQLVRCSVPSSAVDSQSPPRPASHPKLPGKCNRPRCGFCHRHPVSKSKDKAKGARKLRSCDVSLNHRLVSWRVVDRGGDGGAGIACAGVSASGIVGYLAGYHREEADEDYYDEEAVDQGMSGMDEMMIEIGGFGRDTSGGSCDLNMECGDLEEEQDEDEEEFEAGGIGIGETDEMGFYQVGFVWDYVDEDDWCVVGEM